MSSLPWSAADRTAVDTARLLAADAVQKAGNGHPGTAMSLAPVAYYLYQHAMVHDPADPQWIGRDRFVLSAGHSSLTQYVQLYLSGYGLELDDLKALRQWGSLTPGHPEVGHTDGVEITTGPLGSGLASAVGMAMAARRERGLFDPDTAAGESVFDHRVFVIAGDGDLQEGVSSEASSLAGTQNLGNLIVIWDDNRISIEDDTSIAFTEDVSARYEAYGWHVQHVDFLNDGDYTEDIDALHAAVEAAKADPRPSFIRLSTIIAWPSPTAQGTGASHGAALGAEEIAATKKILGFDPEADFAVDDDVLAHARQVRDRGAEAHADWSKRFEQWRSEQPDRAALLDRLVSGELPENLDELFPVFDADAKGVATRAASGKVLNAIAEALPELWGGSADLAGSNNTLIKDAASFLPPERSSEMFSGELYGRNLHFGIREFAAGLICNGIALHGPTRPYNGTFLVFSDYQRPAVRLAALQQVPNIFVWTHDSIGLGEDGPTHQPVEHLSSLRAIPGLDVVRPADANETAEAWKQILKRADGPSGLVLTRQAVPVLDRTDLAPASETAKGGYILKDCTGTPDVILLASGSEVEIALAAAETLAEQGRAVRVVSMPCFEWFAAQDETYRNSVLPAEVHARVSVEAGTAQSWHQFLGTYGRAVSLEHFGASADYKRLYEEFGITAEAVVAAAEDSISAVEGR
ncbi:transketolase [Brevibacterium luteolum]|uniref:transketolase n=1 Tax=Brevibacterium luteolum TaxID=199591 RepID=UPI0021B07C2D|nr:transketolase [Brevibacterium luteolum]MCT1874469.1 transketolase [Brevibacterium luteolum]MCT1890316.1 transketolase [Brevibacterium luteolum]MCT1893756.1 transketolase [Brevibacterium luteolum]MCT1924605.1 transketolase [Brevibacterium luteolum]